ncbi:LOW QUALITY PROTEIN: TGF-beta receptor type-2 [Hippoglossus hippoglossus]|uniref:LOW QUALITY PROTEIN: TGF-beta receptor type-2 n=1 Tax=Hippoglossus hippoglossus TaxID=8267 RepID=UPI00148BD2FD|nr:LOW QUALITY PROTEIN: TGF-beta receptor type-2 [Hippoglossus hippoglossus]XP_035030328.1 TGF-beta receptor type-2 [Hippoglossus stenolepis]
MMARCRTLWTGILVLMTARLPAGVQSVSHLSFNLCKWCEASSPVCKDSVCISNCSLSSFCTAIEEICIAIWRKSNDTMTVNTMCHHPSLPLEGVDPALLLNFTSRECHMVPQPTDDGAMMVCGCQGEHECNDKLIFNKGANGFFKLQSKDVIPVVVVSLVPPVLVAIVATAAFYFYRTHRPDKPGPPARPDWSTKRTPEFYQALDLPCGGGGARAGGAGGLTGPGCERDHSNGKVGSFDSDIISALTDWHGRLSEPLPIKLEVLVGKGRFAEVWRARLLQGVRGGVNSYETVAVKVFPAIEYVSWRNECCIFTDPKLEHGNVVRFLAAEERGLPGPTLRQYWLVLAYHSLGNLQDFITENILSWEELVAMAGSVAKGLAHLHSDTTPSGIPKVPVAHRDLKSSNIVMKSRTECALCDFGLALRLDLALTVDDYANSGQVGTARYMAPEVLESRVNLEDLEAFKQMDVYSMALVLWEMTSRCHAIGEVESYEPAFGSKVCEQPCVDSMRDLVLRDRGRPDIPSAWTQHQGMNVFCSTITECWDHDPEARLTADCVVERFNALQEDEELIPEAVRDKDGDRQKNSETPEDDQIHSSSPSSLQVPQPQTDDTEVSHDSLVPSASVV